MFPSTQLGILFLATSAGTAVVLLVWMRSLKFGEVVSNEKKRYYAESISAKALSDLLADPPNYRSMIDVLRNSLTKVDDVPTRNGQAFLEEVAEPQAMKYVDAQAFRWIYRSYLRSMKLIEMGREK